MNQITLPAAELKLALSGLGKVVSRKSTLPVLSTIKLSRDQQGRVSLSATDLDTFVSYNVEQPQPGKPLIVLLPFEQLNKSVKGASGEVIVTAEARDKVKLRYQIGDSPLEQSVNTTAPDEFPPTPGITQLPVKMPPNFGGTLRQAFETSSTDSSRYVLNGAYLDVAEPKCHTVVSTNGRALFAANTFQFDLKEPVNISRQKFLAWPGFLEGECELAVQPGKTGSGWVQLATPRWNCIVKQIDGQFPKWRQVVPAETETWTKVQLSDAAVSQMLTLSSKLPGDDIENRTLQLRVDRELRLEGRNKDDKNWTGAVITGVNITGKPIITALNREYLQTALRCGLNEVRISTELEPLVFCGPGKKMVVMPVRLSGPAPESKPSPATPQTKPSTNNERTEMTKVASIPPAAEPTSSESAIKGVVEHIEKIKDTLKRVINDFNEVLACLRTAEKEKRATEKEVEAIRATLRSLQRVQI